MFNYEDLYLEVGLLWWARMGSNHGPRSYQERALPLSHAPKVYLFYLKTSSKTIERDIILGMKIENLDLTSINHEEYDKTQIKGSMRRIEEQINMPGRYLAVVDLLVSQLPYELAAGFLTKYFNEKENLTKAIDAKFARSIIRRAKKVADKYPRRINSYFKAMKMDPKEYMWWTLDPIEESSPRL